MWRPLAMALCPGIWPTRKGSSGKLFIATKLMVTMVDMSGGDTVDASFSGIPVLTSPEEACWNASQLPFR